MKNNESRINASQQQLAKQLLAIAVITDGGKLYVPLAAFATIPGPFGFISQEIVLKNARTAGFISDGKTYMQIESGDEEKTKESVVLINRYIVEKTAQRHFTCKHDGSNTRFTKPDAILAYKMLQHTGIRNIGGGQMHDLNKSSPLTSNELQLGIEKGWISKAKLFQGGGIDGIDTYYDGYAFDHGISALESIVGMTRRQVKGLTDVSGKMPYEKRNKETKLALAADSLSPQTPRSRS